MDDLAENTWGEKLNDSEPVAAPRLKLHDPEPVDPLLSQWAKFRDQFSEGMRDGFWTLEDLEQKIADKRAFFFPGRDAAMVGEISVFPGGARCFQILWACGEVAELLQMLPGVESMARMMGCTTMLVEGRPAWKRVLETQDYKLWSVTLHKGL